MLVRFFQLLCFGLIFSNAQNINFQSVKFNCLNCEFNFAFEKIVIINSKAIYLIDTTIKGDNLKEIYKFEEKQKIIPKIGLSNDTIFIATQDAYLKGFSLNGEEVFSKKIPAVSRSEIYFSDGNIFFSLINQFVMCFSEKGELIWINKQFFDQGFIYRNQIIVGKEYVYFLNKSELSLFIKKTGAYISGCNKFKGVRNFYVNDDLIKAYSSSQDGFISYDFLTQDFQLDEENEFPKKIVSKCVEYSYKDGVLKNLNSGKELNIALTNFEFFEDKIFAYQNGGRELLIINGNDISIYDLKVYIKKLIYKNKTLVISDNYNIYWSKIEL